MVETEDGTFEAPRDVQQLENQTLPGKTLTFTQRALCPSMKTAPR